MQPLSFGAVEDHLRLIYPYRTFDAEMLRSLKVPLWNPYTFSGFPYLASLSSAIFYPINVLFMVMPTHLGMNASFILHVLIAGLSMYILGRVLNLEQLGAIMSALAFMFSGFLWDKAVWWAHLAMLSCLSWMPLAFAFFIKSIETKKLIYTILGGLIFAFQLFSGHPQFAYYTLFSLFLLAVYLHIYSLYRKEGLRMALVPLYQCALLAIFGLGLAAVQLIPALELASHSVRSLGNNPFSIFTRWSMEIKYLVSFVFPMLAPLVGKESYPFPIAQGYIGLLPLTFAILFPQYGRKKYLVFFKGLAVLSIILAMGHYTPLYYLLYRFFPGFGVFRNPILFLSLYVFSVAVLAGSGLSRLYETLSTRDVEQIVRFKHWLYGFIIMISLASIVTYLAPQIHSVLTDQGSDGQSYWNTAITFWAKIEKQRWFLIAAMARVLILIALLTGILALWKKIRNLTPSIPVIIILCLTILDLWTYGEKFLKVYNLSPFVGTKSWVTFLKHDKEPFRILPILDYPEQDPVLKLNKMSSINGYGSFEALNDYVSFLSAFQDIPVIQENTITRVTNYNSRAVNMLNTKYIVTTEEIDGDQFKLVYTEDIPSVQTWTPHNEKIAHLRVYENLNAFPRAFLTTSAKVVPNREAILKELQKPELNPRQTVLLEENPHVPINNRSNTPSGHISFISSEPNAFSLKASSREATFLVLSEIYYPGWRAYVDEKQQKIYRANYIFRSLYLPPGNHIVSFIFKPLSFRIGAYISLATIVVLPGLLVLHVRRRNSIN